MIGYMSRLIKAGRTGPQEPGAMHGRNGLNATKYPATPNCRIAASAGGENALATRNKGTKTIH
jgi:hypothetical protein